MLIADTVFHLGHDVFVHFLFRFGPVDGYRLTPELNASRQQFAARHGGRAMTLELDESEAAILGFVGDARVDNRVDDTVRHRLHLGQYFLQRATSASASSWQMCPQ